MTRNQLLIVIVPILFLLFLFFTRDREEEARKAGITQPKDLVGRIMEHNAKNQFEFNDGLMGEAQDSGVPEASPVYVPPPMEKRLLETPKDDYYPPRPSKMPGVAPQSRNWPIPRGITPYFLPDGRPIAFQGEKVFYVNKEGFGEPLPNGYYPLFDSTYMMVVLEGKKVIVE